MALERKQLAAYLEQLLTPQLFEDYGPNGLQVEGSTEIKKVAFAVSATQASLKAAADWKAQALIVHHGIFWKYQGPRPITGAWGERVRLCIKNDLNLFAYHLPLDAHPEVGNAVTLGKAIGMTEFAPFALHKRQPLGTMGRFTTPLKVKELREKLKQVLQHEVVLASSNEEALVHKMGIITGGANNEWSWALNEGLDAYLTGEISEYNWHDAIEAGIHYFAGGHHATERFGIMALMEAIQKQFPDLEVQFFDSPNPA